MVDEPVMLVTLAWIERHAVVPDGFHQGEPFVLLPWQLEVAANMYAVRPTATVGQRSTAFVYRRVQVVMPQKSGKGPFAAAVVLAEAAGPTVFAGFAEGGERYRCRDWGCACGWSYAYAPGEPMGVPQPTPLIQLLATSEDQVANVYRPLRSMVKLGPLTGLSDREGFIRVGDSGRIDVVTSSAQSRLGNPITFAVQDETGTYTEANRMVRTAETMRRGLAGMSGRALETTNAWDPSENSVAQRTYESAAQDVYRYFPTAPARLSYRNRQERHRIHKAVYAGCDHVDLDAIEAEAAELLEHDPAQAERFFGNRVVTGNGSWVDATSWDARCAPREVRDGTRIVAAFDGSETDDWTVLRAETLDGHSFTPKFRDGRPMVWNPADHGGQVPRLEVEAAVEELFSRFDVVVLYADPPWYESEIDRWAERYGDRRVIKWFTRRTQQMWDAAERMRADIMKSDSTWTHDGCPIVTAHVGNTRTSPRPGGKYALVKPSQPQKIDGAVATILAHEAALDCIAAGKARRKKNYYWGA